MRFLAIGFLTWLMAAVGAALLTLMSFDVLAMQGAVVGAAQEFMVYCLGLSPK